MAVEGVTAVKEMVELIVRMVELVEAKLPQSHVLEWALGVFPGHQPIRTGEGDHQEHSGREGAEGTVEQRICQKYT